MKTMTKKEIEDFLNTSYPKYRHEVSDIEHKEKRIYFRMKRYDPVIHILKQDQECYISEDNLESSTVTRNFDAFRL